MSSACALFGKKIMVRGKYSVVDSLIFIRSSKDLSHKFSAVL